MQTKKKHKMLSMVIDTLWFQSQSRRIQTGETKAPPFSSCQSGKTCNTRRNFRNVYQDSLNKFQVGELGLIINKKEYNIKTDPNQT